MSLIRKHGAVLQAWACLALVFSYLCLRERILLFCTVIFLVINFLSLLLYYSVDVVNKNPYHIQEIQELEIIIYFCAMILGESCSAGPEKLIQCRSNTHKR